MPLLGHKVALVTGGARGLGRAIAEALLDRGLKVCIADVRQEVGQVCSAELQAKYGENMVTFLVCDVTKQDEFAVTWAECEEQLGKLDLLVNNAGIGNEQDWKKTLDVNLGGCISGSILAYNLMNKATGGEGGRVINISSIAGVKDLPFGPIYSATKSGIVGFSRALGNSLHFNLTGVKFQCLCPALIETCFLKDALETPFSPDVAKVMAKTAGALKLLPVSEVSAALVQLIEEDQNGGVLVVEPSKPPYYVKAAVE